MALGRPFWYQQKLDGKELHSLWLQLGTLSAVSNCLFKQGTFNTKTGRPFTTVAIMYSVWRWCIKNADESFDATYKYRASVGEYMTREEWNAELMRHAKTCLSSAEYIKLLYGNENDKYKTRNPLVSYIQR